MIPTQEIIGQLAARIENAYRRRYPFWMPIGLTSGLWESAALRLVEASKACPLDTIDPELFVAVQVVSRRQLDPWSELTQRQSLNRYLKSLRQIVRHLRQELKSEVRLAENRLVRGVSLEQVISSEESRISPLTRFIMAHRAGRSDLSLQLRAAAEVQHRSCPLYQLASESFLPGHAYPSGENGRGFISQSLERAAFSLN